MVEKDAGQAAQGRKGAHVLTILRISLIAAAFALLVGALAAVFSNTDEQGRGTVQPSPNAGADQRP